MKNKKTNVRILATALVSVVVFLLNAGVVGAQTYDQTCYNQYLENNLCMDTLSICKSDAENTYQKDIKDCETELNDAKAACCSEFKPGTSERTNCEAGTNLGFDLKNCIDAATAKYQPCLTTADTKRKDTIKKCDADEPAKIEKCNQENEAQAKEECKFECGNGKLEAGEKCDDGNKTDGDGCSASCEIDSDCGDGKVTGSEECDDEEGKKSIEEDKYIDPKSKNKAFDGCYRCKKQNVFRVADWLKIDEGQTYLERSQSPGQSTSLKGGIFYFIITGIELMTKIIGSLALLMVIVGGIVMMVSSGNSQLQQKGKRIILYSILGLVVAFLSLVIVTFVQSLFYTT